MSNAWTTGPLSARAYTVRFGVVHLQLRDWLQTLHYTHGSGVPYKWAVISSECLSSPIQVWDKSRPLFPEWPDLVSPSFIPLINEVKFILELGLENVKDRL